MRTHRFYLGKKTLSFFLHAKPFSLPVFDIIYFMTLNPEADGSRLAHIRNIYAGSENSPTARDSQTEQQSGIYKGGLNPFYPDTATIRGRRRRGVGIPVTRPHQPGIAEHPAVAAAEKVMRKQSP